MRSLNPSLLRICRWYVLSNRLKNVISQGTAQQRPFRTQTRDCRLLLSSTDLARSTWRIRGPCKVDLQTPQHPEKWTYGKLLECSFLSSPKWTRREISKGNPQKPHVLPPVAVVSPTCATGNCDSVLWWKHSSSYYSRTVFFSFLKPRATRESLARFTARDMKVLGWFQLTLRSVRSVLRTSNVNLAVFSSTCFAN